MLPTDRVSARLDPIINQTRIIALDGLVDRAQVDGRSALLITDDKREELGELPSTAHMDRVASITHRPASKEVGSSTDHRSVGGYV